MGTSASPDRVITPEAVAVDLDIAGAGSRLLAAIVDSLIQAVLLIPLAAIVFSTSVDTVGVIAFASLSFLIVFGYYPLLEGLMQGQTPGKRGQRLRVVMADGQPVTWAAVLVRNLVRIVDALPTMYAVGVISIVVTRRDQRLGDLAAGTVVIRERAVEPPVPLDLGPAADPGPVAARTSSSLDVTRLTERDYALVRAFLERRGGLDTGARMELAERVASAVRGRVEGVAPPSSAERFLEHVARAYRDRFSAGAPP